MSEEVAFRFWVYALFLIPVPTLIWAWLRFRRDPMAVWSWRAVASTSCMLLLAVSNLLLLLFPETLETLAGRPLDPADTVYIRAIRFGFFASLVAIILAVCAIKRVRPLLLVSATTQTLFWVFAAGTT